MGFERAQNLVLRQRLSELPNSIIVVAGPRQIGKSYLVRGVLSDRPGNTFSFEAVDKPGQSSAETTGTDIDARDVASPSAKPTGEWLVTKWNQARTRAKTLSSPDSFVLAIDEIQKIPRWSEIVKGLWDEDRAQGLCLHVILLGSSPWLMQKGLTESLAGRYEFIRMSHWSYSEMHEAFDLSLDEYIYFGGYPGSARYIQEERRWRDYIRGALIHPSIEKDILDMTRVDKPALLKNLFELGCVYSGQIISFTKLLGQLQDAGNTVTLAHYLELLSQAGLLTGLPKFAVQKHRQRASIPKLNALNGALISALGNYTFSDARNDRSYWGRLVESAVGAHLFNSASSSCEVYYWRESPNEVDFVLSDKRRTVAFEVSTGAKPSQLKGMNTFVARFKNAQRLFVGDGGIPLVEVLSHSADHWLGD